MSTPSEVPILFQKEEKYFRMIITGLIKTTYIAWKFYWTLVPLVYLAIVSFYTHAWHIFYGLFFIAAIAVVGKGVKIAYYLVLTINEESKWKYYFGICVVLFGFCSLLLFTNELMQILTGYYKDFMRFGIINVVSTTYFRVKRDAIWYKREIHSIKASLISEDIKFIPE